MTTLLQVEGLRTEFATRGGTVRAVDDVSWDVLEGETVALVGESRLRQERERAVGDAAGRARPPGGSSAVEILFKGRDLLTLSEEEMRRVRGREIAMIFQEPMTSLNPVLTDRPPAHRGARAAPAAWTRTQPRARAVELLGMVGIPDAARRLERVPAPVQRRHAPARDDRDGARLRARSCSSPTSRPPRST